MKCLKPGCATRPRNNPHVCSKHIDEVETLLRDRLMANHRKGFHQEGTGGDDRCPLCVPQLPLFS